MATKRLVRISYFTMLTIIGGLISIPLPMVPVKLTFQVLFVSASGLVLGARDGAFSQIAYIVLGLIGVPVFSAGGGIGYVFQPSFGYLIGFIFQAFITGLLVYRRKTLSVVKLFLCAFTGVIVSYAVGITYQVLIVAYYIGNGLAAALSGVPGVLIMLVKDTALVYVLCLLYPRIMTMIGSRNEKSKQNSEQTEENAPEPEEPSPGDEPEPQPVPPAPEPAGIIEP